MATRSNALSEIVRFWLQECHGLLLRESVPVKLQRNYSDIDFVVTAPGKKQVTLLSEIKFTNAIVETKDERDFDPRGLYFKKRLIADYEHIAASSNYTIPKAEKNINFSMFRIQHHTKALDIFNEQNFSKLFIFHKLDMHGIDDIITDLKNKDIHFISSEQILEDIHINFDTYRNGAGIRNSLVGDILDFLAHYHCWRPHKK